MPGLKTNIVLTPPTHADQARLLAFEVANRAFFEARINARPAGYYSAEGVERAIAAAVDDAAHDRAYQYLVKTVGGEIVGRINLTAVRRAHFHSATLGYRVAESAGGRGYASAAVRAVLKLAFGELGLQRIEADSRAENPASVHILVRNGFVQYGHSRRSFELGGVWYDRLHFERHADDGVPLLAETTGRTASMRFDIYGRFQLEVRREHGGWQAYRLEGGKRVPEQELVIPADIDAQELPVYLDDIFHEFAGPGGMVTLLG